MGSTSSQFGSAGILKERAIQERIATAVEAQLGGSPVRGGVNAFSITYIFPSVNFGTGNKTEVIEAVPGYRSNVMAVTLFEVTEAFNGSVTEARIDIGDGVDADEFILTADFGDGDVGIAGTLSPVLTVGDDAIIPVGQSITVTCVAPNDAGANTGIGSVAVTLQYYL